MVSKRNSAVEDISSVTDMAGTGGSFADYKEIAKEFSIAVIDGQSSGGQLT